MITHIRSSICYKGLFNFLACLGSYGDLFSLTLLETPKTLLSRQGPGECVSLTREHHLKYLEMLKEKSTRQQNKETPSFHLGKMIAKQDKNESTTTQSPCKSSF